MLPPPLLKSRGNWDNAALKTGRVKKFSLEQFLPTILNFLRQTFGADSSFKIVDAVGSNLRLYLNPGPIW